MSRNIYQRRWVPDKPRDGLPGIYLLHGVGEHSGRYQELAKHLCANGWFVGSHDHPGHGQSSGQRGAIEPAGALVTQAAIQISLFARKTGSTPIVLGHSLGGVVATELALVHRLPMTGLILSAPAFSPLISATDRFKLRLLTQIAPDLCLELGYDPTTLTRDQQEQQLALDDPLIHSFKSAQLVNWIIESGARSLTEATNMEVPTLILIPSADPIADPEKMQEFSNNLPQELVSTCEYPDALHEVFHEIEDVKFKAFKDVDDWLERLPV